MRSRSLIGVVNGKAYDSIVMGLGLFIGLSLLNKNSFDISKAVQEHRRNDTIQ